MRLLINDDKIINKVYNFAMGLINDADEFTSYKIMCKTSDNYKQKENLVLGSDFTFAEMLGFMECTTNGIMCFRRDDWTDKRECVYLNNVSIPFTPILKKRVVLKLNNDEKQVPPFMNGTNENGISTWGVPFTPTDEDMFNHKWLYVGKLDQVEVGEEFDI